MSQQAQEHEQNEWRHQNVKSLCIGTGRFLRSVLVPMMLKHEGEECGEDTNSNMGMRSSPSFSVVLIQPRGRSFVEFMHKHQQEQQQSGNHNVANCYPVDTVLPTSTTTTTSEEKSQESIQTDFVGPIAAVFSWGQEEDRQAFYTHCLPYIYSTLELVGIGLTEAGLISCNTSAMQNLFEFISVLHRLFHNDNKKNNNQTQSAKKVVLLNTDNVPHNGSVIRQHMFTLARKKQEAEPGTATNDTHATLSLLEFLETRLVFLDTMVDRIVSQRSLEEPMIPKAEPTPQKALVVLDPNQDLPAWFVGKTTSSSSSCSSGLVVRHSRLQLQADVALKLRIANATHTAVAHAMALQGVLSTTELAFGKSWDWIMAYLDSLFDFQILPACLVDSGIGTVITAEDVCAVWMDWRARLMHPTFGASTFFITQNGAAKGGIRFGATLANLMNMLLLLSSSQQGQPTMVGQQKSTNDDVVGVQASFVYAVAVLLRWLTPDVLSESWWRRLPSSAGGSGSIIYRGRLATDCVQSSNRRYQEDNETAKAKKDSGAVTYGDGLRYNLEEGWYEFKCDCPLPKRVATTMTEEGQEQQQLAMVLAELSMSCNHGSMGAMAARQPIAYVHVIRAYLTSSAFPATMTRNPEVLETLVYAVATLYARLMAGDKPLDLMQEMLGHNKTQQKHEDAKQEEEMSVYNPLGCQTPCHTLVDDPTLGKAVMTLSMTPLHYRPHPIPKHSFLINKQDPSMAISNVEEMASVIVSEVASVQVIDLHTHLLPPKHGPLCLWGIDELLTYHYLVAEFFMTAPPSLTPQAFYNELTKEQQADWIWQALFVDRLPLSEACRGIVTSLLALGLHEAVRNRDLPAIRTFYQAFRKDGSAGAERFSDLVFRTAGVRYNIMTNIPFEAKEAHYWRNKVAYDSKHYKSAVRVDPLLKGDQENVELALRASGYEVSLEGARQYLRDWCDTMQPEYVMASTPHDFALPPADTESQEATTASTFAQKTKASINPSALQQPGAFADAILQTTAAVAACGDDETGDDSPSVINEASDYLSEVLMKVCEERDLPLALKIGAHRAVNPSLRQAGDGVVAFCDTAVLRRLCTRFPKVRFLATFLSKNNQHEACVLATKFRNLHLYGCWWFCNNPSIVEEITKMRVELLGTAFTSQHSDARVLDQLLYKWPHSRAVIAQVLVTEYQKLLHASLLSASYGGGGGWAPTRHEIRRDIRRLFGGSYEEFMAKSLL